MSAEGRSPLPGFPPPKRRATLLGPAVNLRAALSRQPQNVWAILVGTMSWFVVDSLQTIKHGAWFNIFLINLPVLIVMGLPLVMTRKAFRRY